MSDSSMDYLFPADDAATGYSTLLLYLDANVEMTTLIERSAAAIRDLILRAESAERVALAAWRRGAADDVELVARARRQTAGISDPSVREQLIIDLADAVESRPEPAALSDEPTDEELWFLCIYPGCRKGKRPTTDVVRLYCPDHSKLEAGRRAAPGQKELTVRDNPSMPDRTKLEELRCLGGLEAVWRDGCDAGMVAT